MSFRNIGALAGAFAGRHYLPVTNDASGATSVSRTDRAPHRDVDRVWAKLLDHGWMPEFPLPRYQQPGFAGQAITALLQAFPHGLTGDDYLPLLAALNRDVDGVTVDSSRRVLEYRDVRYPVREINLL